MVYVSYKLQIPFLVYFMMLKINSQSELNLMRQNFSMMESIRLGGITIINIVAMKASTLGD